jgi:hypothetical protein
MPCLLFFYQLSGVFQNLWVHSDKKLQLGGDLGSISTEVNGTKVLDEYYGLF